LCTDRTKDTPADDQAFKIYFNLHSYSKTDLKATVESVDDSASQYWRKERISFQTAYGNERLGADLFLPKNFAQPYQIILFFPGSGPLTSKVLDPYEVRSRVTTPVLVLSGRYDFVCVLEPTVLPLFHLLGTPEKDKQLKIYERGHALFDGLEVFKDRFLWLDRYLGRPAEMPSR
jgi:hypothetical protein